VEFFEALGREWNVRIIPPAGSGMTVQNIATAVFDPAQGAGRPVFLHESLHALLATDLRVLSTNDQHRWLQEGLASYVQGALYPQSFDRKQLAEQFRTPIEAGNAKAFKPLARLLGRRNTIPDYPQLATLIAFLIDQHPKWLSTIATELSSGRSAEQAVRKCGVSLEELQAAWVKWGAAKVGDANDAGVLLAVPEEFRTIPTD
jgi:hypothetical protein